MFGLGRVSGPADTTNGTAQQAIFVSMEEYFELNSAPFISVKRENLTDGIFLSGPPNFDSDKFTLNFHSKLETAMTTRRLYLGRLPPDARSEDVQKFFDGFGRMVDCRVMTGFGFVEFETARDAEEVVNNFNGKTFLGAPIVVEFAKENRPRRDDYQSDRGSGGFISPRARRPPGVRVAVTGISRDTSWQDLKDFGREGGNVTFADIDRDVPGQGVLEYATKEDADNAVRQLDGKDLRGQGVRVALSEDRGSGGSGRDDRYDRHDRGPPPRRERSRSPPRRNDYDRDRRPRSPPPRTRSPPPRDYADRRPEYDDRRHDDRRPAYDDRRRDRDDRRDDRGGRSNGEPSYASRPHWD